jgi:hypothetical protein
MPDESPFADVHWLEAGAFSLPQLKWREILFVGAMRPDGDAFVRDPSRPLPAFAAGNLFPEHQRFSAAREGARVRLVPLPAA